jgi:very-short-patch-repair endonuclease
VRETEGESALENLALTEAKLCANCGYLHPLVGGISPDLCQSCDTSLTAPLRQLFRLQNVATKRRDRISSDEEERQRQGYELLTGVRFAEQDGVPSYQVAAVERGGTKLADLTYGHTATLWRINLGWTRRANKAQQGFMLDMERGYWERNEQTEDDEGTDPMSPVKARVIPYVEDRRNCLLFEPAETLSMGTAASLMAALKRAIQVLYQLEDNELAAEALPSRTEPRLILLYESAEGGAGVLRRLLDDPGAFAGVAREALRICHFDPETGADCRHADNAREDCEAACYDCLMNYTNQRDHRLLDRQAIRALLLDLAGASVAAAPGPAPRADHLAGLLRQAGSDLERAWLRYLEQHGLRLPTHAQLLIAECGTRPDFFYAGEYNAAVYIDGPVHQYAHRHARDVAQSEAMEDAGYRVIRFTHDEDWAAKIARYPSVFGKESA